MAGEREKGFVVDGRLQLARIVGQDGSRFDDEVIDTEWDAACDLRTEFCAVPTINEQTRFFTDAGCTDRIWRLECTQPTHLFLYGVERVFDPYAGPVFHDSGHGSLVCGAWDESLDDPETVSYYRAGNAVEQGHMLASAGWTLRGSERLQLRDLAGVGGEVWPVANWLTADARYHDKVLDVDCAPFWRSDGVAYCLKAMPHLREGQSEYGFYSDPECKEPAALCVGCDRALVVADDGESHLVRLTPQNGAYFKQGLDTCVFDPENQNTAKLGETLPWDDEVRFTQTNQPPLATP